MNILQFLQGGEHLRIEVILLHFITKLFNFLLDAIKTHLQRVVLQGENDEWIYEKWKTVRIYPYVMISLYYFVEPEEKYASIN